MTRHACPGCGPNRSAQLPGRPRPDPADRRAGRPGGDRRLERRTGWSSTRPWPTSPDGWLSEYVPTPVLSPWNGGSGFGAKDKEPKRRLEALLARTIPEAGGVPGRDRRGEAR